MKKKLVRFIPLGIMLALLTCGCAQDKAGKETVKAPEAAQKTEGNVYKGKIAGKSNKAKSISITVGQGDKAKTIMVKFDDATKGVEHAAEGDAAVITYEMRDGQAWATVIKPKLAKLPQGVTEIKTPELKTLLETKTDLILVDARPVNRYTEAHILGAINIPVPDYKEQAAAILPKDKDRLIITYCGGPT